MNGLILGAKGRLGRAVAKLEPGFTAWGRPDLDVTDAKAVHIAITQLAPEVVINCSGFTDVDACETRIDECWKTNVYGVKNIIAACRDNNARLVHISSNYAANPLNEYAWTKLASERLAEPFALVIRTGFYHNGSFLVKALLYGSEPVNAYTDLQYNPISVHGLAHEVVARAKGNETGVVNVGTRDKVSPHVFAREFCKTFGIDESRVKPAKGEAPGAKRCKDIYITPANNVSLSDDLRLFKDELER